MFARPHRRNFVVARFFTTVPGGRLVWRHRGKHPSANLDEVTDNKTCVPANRFRFFLNNSIFRRRAVAINFLTNLFAMPLLACLRTLFMILRHSEFARLSLKFLCFWLD